MASLNPRDRNLVVLGVLAVFIAGGYWYQFWSPKDLELDESPHFLDVVEACLDREAGALERI